MIGTLFARLYPLFLAIGLIAAPQADVDAAELLMFESDDCIWCDAWDAEIAPIYPKTSEGRRAPLRRIDIHDPRPLDLQNIEGVQRALPDKPIAILEAGWATTASEFGERASEELQSRHYAELDAWARETNTTVFFFEAFDEPWKGDPNDRLGAEKHWGVFFVDRTPKQVINDHFKAHRD